jgi:hypothetical protein
MVRRTLVTGPAAMAVMMETKDKVDAFLQDDNRIMTSKLCATGIKLKQQIRRVWPNRKMNQVLFLHDSQILYQPLHKGGNYNNGVNRSPSSSLQYQFSIFQLPSFWTLKNALQQAETQHV